MRILITGAISGTLAPKVAALATQRGHEVIRWDRLEVSPDDAGALAGFVERVRPDAIAHLALGAPEWAGRLAAEAASRDIPMLFTSTAMVFAQRPDGPYDIWAPRTADTDYGRYKIRCEDAIWDSNPAAMVARIGYQIDPDGRGNNMLAHLDAQHAAAGLVRASDRWIPATSFMSDTAGCLLELLSHPQRGLHHLDSNAEDAWDYRRIVTALARRMDRHWEVVPAAEPVNDQRLIGRAQIAALSERLAG